MRYLPKNYKLSILSFEPVYKFCEEKGIKFTEEEKSFLKLALLHEKLRKEILEEFPKEDIINATLNYYAKNCILKYFYLLRDERENSDKYKEERAKAEELNNPKDKLGKAMKKASNKILKNPDKKFGFKEREHKIEFNTIKSFVYSSKLEATPSLQLLRIYLDELEKNRGLILSVDKKILSALDIYPQDLQVKKITPPKFVKKVLRPDQDLNLGIACAKVD